MILRPAYIKGTTIPCIASIGRSSQIREKRIITIMTTQLEQKFLAADPPPTLNPAYHDPACLCQLLQSIRSRICLSHLSWGTLLSNDVVDYICDGLSGRVVNICWSVGTWDSPIECARMFRGCVIAVAQAAHYAPGALFALLNTELGYMYSGRYSYSNIPCDTTLPYDDTYMP